MPSATVSASLPHMLAPAHPVLIKGTGLTSHICVQR